MGKKSIEKKRLSFQEAVKSTPQIGNCYQIGKQAVKKDERTKIEFSDPRKCGGSLFIDECVQNEYPNDNRWDYAIDYKGFTHFIEVHTANDSEVKVLLKKLQWLKDWLISSAPNLNAIKAKSPFFWIQTSGYHITRNSKYERLAIQNGIKPISKLRLG
jgi:hypothetical protein